MTIDSENAVRATGRPKGKDVTIEAAMLSEGDEECCQAVTRELSRELKSLSLIHISIAFGLCGCKKDDATVHFASETEQTAVVSSDVNRQTADPKEKKASSDGEQEQKAKDTADDTDESTEWCVYI